MPDLNCLSICGHRPDKHETEESGSPLPDLKTNSTLKTLQVASSHGKQSRSIDLFAAYLIKKLHMQHGNESIDSDGVSPPYRRGSGTKFKAKQ